MDMKNMENPRELLKAASPEVQKVVKKVLEIENEKLYMKKPLGIVEDIEKIIREVVK